MQAYDREVHLVTGHVGSGKSHTFRSLCACPEYGGSDVFLSSTDTIRVKYYKEWSQDAVEDNSYGHLALDRILTEWDKVYNNELLRVDAERALLVDHVQKVLLDVVMRTRRFHQRPFVAMIKKVEHYLRRIEAKRAAREEMLPPDPPSRVNLRVVLLFCNFDAVRQRLMRRWDVDEETALRPFCQSTLPYELPTAYPFLATNTSDESSVAEAERLEEVRQFFAGQTIDASVMTARAAEAQRCVAVIKREILKRGFRKKVFI